MIKKSNSHFIVSDCEGGCKQILEPVMVSESTQADNTTRHCERFSAWQSTARVAETKQAECSVRHCEQSQTAWQSILIKRANFTSKL